MTALFDALDSVPSWSFFGWLAIAMVAFSVGAHFAQWRRL